MKNKQITELNYLEKRNIKFSNAYSIEQKKEFADYSLNNGNITDAIEMYIALDMHPEVDKLISGFIDNGDYFHYTYVYKLLKKQPEINELKKIKDSAQKNGFNRYAEQAQKEIENIEGNETDIIDKTNTRPTNKQK